MFCKLVALPACLLAQMSLGCVPCKSCHQPFGSDRLEHTSHSMWVSDSPPCLVSVGRGHSRLLSIYKIVSACEGLSATLSLDYRPPCLCAAQKCCTAQCCLCSGAINFTCLPVGLSVTGPHSFQELLPVLLVRWGQKTSPCESAPYLGVGRLGI